LEPLVVERLLPLELLEIDPLDPEGSDLGPLTIAPDVPVGALITEPNPITVQKDKVFVVTLLPSFSSEGSLPVIFEEFVSSDDFSPVVSPSFSVFLLVYLTKSGNYKN